MKSYRYAHKKAFALLMSVLMLLGNLSYGLNISYAQEETLNVQSAEASPESSETTNAATEPAQETTTVEAPPASTETEAPPPEESGEPVPAEENSSEQTSIPVTVPSEETEIAAPEETVESAPEEQTAAEETVEEPQPAAAEPAVAPDNVTGQLVKATTPMANLAFSVRTAEGEEKWYDAKTNENGEFGFALPDGKYELKGIWIEAENKWYELNKTFTVVDSILLEKESLHIDLANVENKITVTGTLTKEAAPLAEISFSLHTTTGEEKWYAATTDESGNFSFALPDGSYEIDGVWVEAESKWYQLDQTFEVANGALANAESLAIELSSAKTPPAVNVTGTITNSAKVVADVSFSFHTTEGDEVWYDAQTNANGEFEITLPDGSYEIDGVWVEAESKWYQLDQEFAVTGGKLAGADSLQIKLGEEPPAVNITGTVSSKGLPVADTWFSFHTAEGDEVWYDAQTNANGEFGITLSDGSYEIDGVWVEAENKWYQLDQTFAVTGGVLAGADSLQIKLGEEPIAVNITGTVSNKGVPVAGTWFSVHTTEGNEVWYDAQTNANGEFGFTLPNGKYEIEGVWVEAENKWYQLDQTFSVLEGKLAGAESLKVELAVLDVPPAFNVQGTVVNGSAPVTDTWFSVHTTTGDEAWYDAQTNASGEFGFNLPDGEYQIDGIWVEAESKWYELNKKFTVAGSKIVGEISINLSGEAAPTAITGTVLNNKVPVANTAFSFHTIESEAVWYDTQTDANGQFNAELPDGTYQIDGIWIESENKWYELNYQFAVAGGQLAEQLAIDLYVPEENVKGSVTDANGPIGNVDLFLWNQGTDQGYTITSNEDGTFSESLPDGIYVLDSLMEKNKNIIWLNQSFTVKGGKLFVDGIEQATWNISVPIVSFVGTLLDKGVAVAQAKLIIENEHESFTAVTGEDGTFQSRLSDGEYTLQAIYLHDGTYVKVNQTIQVVNGTTSPNPYQLDLSEITLPAADIPGTVSTANGPAANATVGITDLETGDWYEYDTNANGQFTAVLTDGSYQANTIWLNGSEVSIAINFTVEEGKLVINGESKSSLDLVVPNGYKAVVMENGQPVANQYIWFHAYNSDGNYQGFAFHTDANGSFTFYTDNSSYKINSISTQDTQWSTLISLGFKDGVLTVNEKVQDHLVLDIPPVSVKGQILDGKVPVSGAHIALVQNELRYYGNTDDNGNFSLRLPDGVYELYSIWYEQSHIPLSGTVTLKEGVLTVNGEVQEKLTITLPAINVKGQIKDGEVPLGNVSVYFQKQDGNNYHSFYARTNEDGTFEARFPDGTYKVREVYYNNEWIQLGNSFTVENGQLKVNGEAVDQLELSLPAINVKGQVLDGEMPLADVQVNVVKGDYEDWFYTRTDENGYFHFRLPDGTYKVRDIYVNNSWISVGMAFTVENGQLKVSGQPEDQLVVGIPDITVQGQVLDGDTPAANAEVNIMQGDHEEWFYARTNENGQFNFRLPDGSYQVNSVNVGGSTVPMAITFTVENGQLKVNGQVQKELVLTVPPVTVTGQLLDSESFVADAQISVVKGEHESYYYARTNQNGQFELRLPDGTYKVRDIYVDNSSVAIALSFTVENGQLKVNGQAQEQLVVSIPPVTVTGQLFDGETPVSDTQISVVKGNYESHYYTHTSQNGQFEFRLPDGTYKVSNIYLNNSSITLSVSFVVENGQLKVNGQVQDQLLLTVPPVTVTGQVLEGEASVANVSIYFEKQDGDKYQSFSVRTNGEGNFAARLPDGAYKVREAYYNNERIPLSDSFTVENGQLKVNGQVKNQLIVNIPPVTVTGQLLDSKTPLANAEITVIKGDYESYHYTRTDQNGQFKFRLPNGVYKVSHINFNNSLVPMDLLFTIENGQLRVNGQTKNQLIVNMPSVTVTGQLLDGQALIANTDVNVVKDGEYKTHYYTRTDQNGQFEFRLPDGTYEVSNIYLKNSTVEMALSFTVENGQLKVGGEAKDQLVITMPPVTVTGQLLDGEIPVANAEIQVTKGNYESYYYTVTDQNGKFDFRLPDGTYKVSYVYLNNSWVEMALSFTIENGQLKINGQAEDQLVITGPPVTLRGQLLDSEVLIGNTAIQLEKQDGNNSRWFSIYTNEDGNFEARLSDGIYKVTGVYYEDKLIPLGDSFTIENGQLKVNGEAKNQLVIIMPPVTVTGQLLESETPLANVLINVVTSDYKNHYQTHTDENGQFEFRLPDGIYTVNGVYLNNNSVSVDLSFTVESGQLKINSEAKDQLIVVVLPVTVTGQLMNGETPLGNIEIRVEKGDQESYHYAYTDQNGQFNFRLPDGTYQVNGFYYSGWVEMSDSFTVENGQLKIDGEVQESLTLTLPAGN